MLYHINNRGTCDRNPTALARGYAMHHLGGILRDVAPYTVRPLIIPMEKDVNAILKVL